MHKGLINRLDHGCAALVSLVEAASLNAMITGIADAVGPPSLALFFDEPETAILSSEWCEGSI